MLGGLWPTFGDRPLEHRFPLEARGDIHFQVDVMRTMDQADSALDVLVSLPEGAFRRRAAESSGGDSLDVRVRVALLDTGGKAFAEYSTDMALPSPSPTNSEYPVPRRWLRLRPRWLPGTAGLQVKIEDPQRTRGGLWHQIKGTPRAGTAAARLVEARAPRRLSDPLFVWGVPENAGALSESELRTVRESFEPNPYRYYGLYQPVMTVYWERYPAAGPAALAGEAAPPDRLVEELRILRLADSVLVYSAAESLRTPAAPGWTLRRFDCSGQPGGSYLLSLTLRDDAGELASRRAEFQIVWERESWLHDERELLDQARAVLPADVYEEFEGLDRGAKEAYLRDLWARHSGGVPAAEDPLRRKFAERMRYADENFKGLRRGALSDRGRVYVRYGAPDEVRRQLNPQDEEMLWIALPEEIESDAVGEEQTRLSRRRTRVDNSAYEIWEYIARGDPLFPEYVNPNQKIGLKFVFVDEMGTGEYALVYTNVPNAVN